MALATNFQTIVSTDRKIVLQFRMDNDGSTDNLPFTDLLDPADYTSTDGSACSYISIDRMWYAVEGGLHVNLDWNATGKYIAWTFGGTSGSSQTSTQVVDFTLGGWGGLIPPGLGGTTSTGDSGAGNGTPDGKLIISTSGIAANDIFTIIVEGTKHYDA